MSRFQWRGPVLSGLVLLAAAGWLAPPAATAADADHLVVSQVVTYTRYPLNGGGSEFIQITNPTAAEIDLSEVHLSDANLGPTNFYYNIVTGASAGGGTGGSVHCRFPDGAVLAAGASVVIALQGSTHFENEYGFLPDFEMYEDGLAPDAVAEMAEVFPGSIGYGLGGGINEPDLSNTIDSIVLYRWDGASDLVEDLDYVIWGGTSPQVRVSKTGVAVDGPDAGTETTAYANDTATGAQDPVNLSGFNFGMSIARVGVDEGTETATGGNGATGHDETSENLSATWVVQAAAPLEPTTAPQAPAPIWSSVALASDAPYSNQPNGVTVDLLSYDSVSSVSVFYRVDGGAWTEVGAVEGAEDWTVEIPGQSGGATVEWYLTATGAGGGTTAYPAGAPVFPASFEVQAPPTPVFTNVSQSPLEPYADNPTTLTAQFETPDAVSAVSLWWQADGGGYAEVAMVAAGGNWSGAVPGQSGGVVVEWYLEAEGLGGETATWPAGAPGTVESFTVADEPPVSTGPVHLLMTEVCVIGSAEFVEIYNPTGQAVDLTNYYLSDGIYSPGSQYYWRIVEPVLSQTNVGGGAFADFHARFPEGARIAAHDTITVSIGGSDAFAGTFGAQPTFELFEDGTSADDVPDFRPVWSTDANNNSIFSVSGDSYPTLSNATEIVVLYHWDGLSDLVTDIDVFRWGTSTSAVFSKSGVSIDGPDADTTPSSYLPETGTTAQRPYPGETAFAGDVPESYQRIGDEGDEVATGSNGVGGNDEVSENWAVTFEIAPARPARPPVPSGSGDLDLVVPARTFLPHFGETFPVRFTSLRNNETWVRIFDLEGRAILTLFDSRKDGFASSTPGQYTRRDWNGRDQVFELVPAGMYIVHMQAVDRQTGDMKSITAPVVVATRLSR